MSLHWYALRTKPHKERAVHELLLAREIEVYFPRLRVTPKNPRAARVRSYFPGYMFVRVDLEEIGLNGLSWLPGVHGLVSFGGVAASVPDALIRALMERLPQEEPAREKRLEGLRKGDRVRITDGPFAGYTAIFDAELAGRDRVQVLLAFLSRQPHKLQLDADAIRPESR